MRISEIMCIGLGLALSAISADYKRGNHSILYGIDEAGRTLIVMGETAYDPKTDEGSSLYKIKWDDSTVFYNRAMNVPANKVKPGSTAIVNLDAPNANRLKNGEAFKCSTVEVYEDERAYNWNEAKRLLTTKIWPTGPNSYQVDFDGKRISGEGTLWVYTRGTVKDMQIRLSDLWISGGKNGEDFLARTIVNTLEDDPRKEDDPKLPSALVVGDSISMNYHNAAKAALKGKFNYHRIPANSGDTNRGKAMLAMWVGDYKNPKYSWQVIVLNHGLHDLLQYTDKDTGAFLEKHKVDIEDYKKNLEKELRFLSQTGAKLIWCMTTPVPGSSYSWGPYSRRKDEELKYNAAAAEVLKKYPQVQICDLNAVVRNSAIFDEWRKGTNVHYRPGPEQDTLGKAVAEAILKAYEAK